MKHAFGAFSAKNALLFILWFPPEECVVGCPGGGKGYSQFGFQGLGRSCNDEELLLLLLLPPVSTTLRVEPPPPPLADFSMDGGGPLPPPKSAGLPGITRQRVGLLVKIFD
jgi:hypothetical protein